MLSPIVREIRKGDPLYVTQNLFGSQKALVRASLILKPDKKGK